MYRCIGVSVHGCIGVLVYWYIGVLVYWCIWCIWCIGVVMYLVYLVYLVYFGVLMYWCSDVLMLVVAACTSAQVHVQAQEDARKRAEEDARMKAAESEPFAEPNVASAVVTHAPLPQRRLEADLRKLFLDFVSKQPGFHNFSPRDLDDATYTWAEVFESQVFLRDQPDLSRHLLDSAGNPALAFFAREVAVADMRMTEALANFSQAYYAAFAPAAAAAVPHVFRLDPGVLESNPVGFRPERAHAPFCGVVPVGSGALSHSLCPDALVLVRDRSGMTFTLRAPRRDVDGFNRGCTEIYRAHGANDGGIGQPDGVSAAHVRTITPPSGSTAPQAADDVWLASEAHHDPRTPDRSLIHHPPAPRDPSHEGGAVGSAQESDAGGGRRRQPVRGANSSPDVAAARVVSKPTGAQDGAPSRLDSPRIAAAGTFVPRRIIPSPNQLFNIVNEMMTQLEQHRTRGFGRAVAYGVFGMDSVETGETLSREGLAVCLRVTSPCDCTPESEPWPPSLDRPCT